MPSGSHGGSSGGHSGGSSFGGGSSRTPSKAFTHRYDVHHTPHRYTFMGRSYSVGSYRYYTMSKTIRTMLTIAGFLVMALIFYFEQMDDIEQILDDQAYYFNMIETADSDQYMIADVKGQFLGEGGRYYITYNLDYNGNDLWREDGYTYSIYTMEEAASIFQSGEIEIVVEGLPLNSDTDSINSNYMDFDITDDGSYIVASRYRSLSLVIGSVGLAIIAGFAVYYFKQMFSNEIKPEERSKFIRDSVNHEDEKPEYCIYCGALMSPNDSVCSNCGSARSYSSK